MESAFSLRDGLRKKRRNGWIDWVFLALHILAAIWLVNLAVREPEWSLLLSILSS